MSGTYNGGSLNRAASELYEYIIYPHYGESGFKNSKMARRVNPFKDSIISELIYDVFCVVDSYDYFIAGNIIDIDKKADLKRDVIILLRVILVKKLIGMILNILRISGSKRG